MLPDALWSVVYEFDNTKHDTFANVLREFEWVNRFWYLDFVTQTTMTSAGMRLTREEVVKLNRYWNTGFLNQEYLTEHTKESWHKDGVVCTPQHEVDTRGWTRAWQLLHMNIKCYSIVHRSRI